MIKASIIIGVRKMEAWNRKRVWRVYRDMKLILRRNHKKRLKKRVKQPLETPSNLNECWSLDFMIEALTDGRKLRIFNVIDDCNCEAIVIDAGLSYPRAVVETLENLKDEIGAPKYARCDNRPEYINNIDELVYKKPY